MGMPPVYIAPDDDFNCEIALSHLLLSVAMGQSALAHILNAEGEVLQLLADRDNAEEMCQNSEPMTIDRYITLSSSAMDVVHAVQGLQCRLMKKLSIANQSLGVGTELPVECQ